MNQKDTRLVIGNRYETLRLADKSLHQLFKGVVGSGNIIRFWFDIWIGNTPLKNRWPSLYSLERNKGCKVRDRFTEDGSMKVFAGLWRRQPRTVEELSEMQDLMRLFHGISLRDGMDSWLWNNGVNGSFTVADCKKLIRSDVTATSGFILKWEAWVPIKVNLLTWRAGRDRLPTRVNLHRRRVNVPDPLCPFCRSCDEDINHLMIGCGFAYSVWSSICTWCKLAPFFAYDFDDLMMLYNNVHAGKWRKKITRGITMITAWAIWNARNEKIFQNRDCKVAGIVAEVKSKAFLWLKHRSKHKNIVWKDWASYPLYMCL